MFAAVAVVGAGGCCGGGGGSSVIGEGNCGGGGLPVSRLERKKMHICNWKITRFLFYDQPHTIILVANPI